VEICVLLAKKREQGAFLERWGITRSTIHWWTQRVNAHAEKKSEEVESDMTDENVEIEKNALSPEEEARLQELLGQFAMPEREGDGRRRASLEMKHIGVELFALLARRGELSAFLEKHGLQQSTPISWRRQVKNADTEKVSVLSPEEEARRQELLLLFVLPEQQPGRQRRVSMEMREIGLELFALQKRIGQLKTFLKEQGLSSSTVFDWTAQVRVAKKKRDAAGIPSAVSEEEESSDDVSSEIITEETRSPVPARARVLSDKARNSLQRFIGILQTNSCRQAVLELLAHGEPMRSAELKSHAGLAYLKAGGCVDGSRPPSPGYQLSPIFLECLQFLKANPNHPAAQSAPVREVLATVPVVSVVPEQDEDASSEPEEELVTDKKRASQMRYARRIGQPRTVAQLEAEDRRLQELRAQLRMPEKVEGKRRQFSDETVAIIVEMVNILIIRGEQASFCHEMGLNVSHIRQFRERIARKGASSEESVEDVAASAPEEQGESREEESLLTPEEEARLQELLAQFSMPEASPNGKRKVPRETKVIGIEIMLLLTKKRELRPFLKQHGLFYSTLKRWQDDVVNTAVSVDVPPAEGSTEPEEKSEDEGNEPVLDERQKKQWRYMRQKGQEKTPQEIEMEDQRLQELYSQLQIPEVVEGERRQFSDEAAAIIVEVAGILSVRGELGAFLRKHNLKYQHITTFRERLAKKKDVTANASSKEQDEDRAEEGEDDDSFEPAMDFSKEDFTPPEDTELQTLIKNFRPTRIDGIKRLKVSRETKLHALLICVQLKKERGAVGEFLRENGLSNANHYNWAEELFGVTFAALTETQVRALIAAEGLDFTAPPTTEQPAVQVESEDEWWRRQAPKRMERERPAKVEHVAPVLSDEEVLAELKQTVGIFSQRKVQSVIALVHATSSISAMSVVAQLGKDCERTVDMLVKRGFLVVNEQGYCTLANALKQLLPEFLKKNPRHPFRSSMDAARIIQREKKRIAEMQGDAPVTREVTEEPETTAESPKRSTLPPVSAPDNALIQELRSRNAANPKRLPVSDDADEEEEEWDDEEFADDEEETEEIHTDDAEEDDAPVDDNEESAPPMRLPKKGFKIFVDPSEEDEEPRRKRAKKTSDELNVGGDFVPRTLVNITKVLPPTWREMEVWEKSVGDGRTRAERLSILHNTIALGTDTAAKRAYLASKNCAPADAALWLRMYQPFMSLPELNSTPPQEVFAASAEMAGKETEFEESEANGDEWDDEEEIDDVDQEDVDDEDFHGAFENGEHDLVLNGSGAATEITLIRPSESQKERSIAGLQDLIFTNGYVDPAEHIRKIYEIPSDEQGVADSTRFTILTAMQHDGLKGPEVEQFTKLTSVPYSMRSPEERRRWTDLYLASRGIRQGDARCREFANLLQLPERSETDQKRIMELAKHIFGY
jgi:hypothetical protein